MTPTSTARSSVTACIGNNSTNNSITTKTTEAETMQYELFETAKESLWTIYATYCSMADSSDPGKLSGPNTIALLSSIGLLTNHFSFYKIGMLIHNIISQQSVSRQSVPFSPAPNMNSNNNSSVVMTPTGRNLSIRSFYSPRMTQTQNSTTSSLPSTPVPMNSTTTGNTGIEDADTDYQPSLSFEEFLVFLYMYSQLRSQLLSYTSLVEWNSFCHVYLTEISQTMSMSMSNNTTSSNNAHTPIKTPLVTHVAVTTPTNNTSTNNNTNTPNSNSNNNKIISSAELWFQAWQKRMLTSVDFKQLIQTIAASRQSRMVAAPQDARNRDRYGLLFSLEILQSIQKIENKLYTMFSNANTTSNTNAIEKSYEKQVDMITDFLIKNRLFTTKKQVFQHVYNLQYEDEKGR